LETYIIMEMDENEKIELDGGYGYHPSQVPGSITVGKAIGRFFDNFIYGLSDCSCVKK
jgi:hypothetical protein